MKRYIGVDYGAKRIGLSVGDSRTRVAVPLATVAGTGSPGGDARAVLAAVREYAAHAFVVGLPLNMDGTEGKQAGQVRKFAAALEESSGVAVCYWDERLSSFEADQSLARSGLTHGRKKKRRDQLAAGIILQEFLDAQPHDASGSV